MCEQFIDDINEWAELAGAINQTSNKTKLRVLDVCEMAS